MRAMRRPWASAACASTGDGRAVVDPADYPRRVLLSVVGLTPQIVTESLYTLAVERKLPFVQTDILLVTTSAWRERALLTLLDPDKDVLAKLAADYHLPALVDALRPEFVHVIQGADGSSLDDFRTPADNAAAADVLTDLIRDLTSDPAAAAHVSIGGGRKTMGFLAGSRIDCRMCLSRRPGRRGPPQMRNSNEVYRTAWQVGGSLSVGRRRSPHGAALGPCAYRPECLICGSDGRESLA